MKAILFFTLIISLNLSALELVFDKKLEKQQGQIYYSSLSNPSEGLLSSDSDDISDFRIFRTGSSLTIYNITTGEIVANLPIDPTSNLDETNTYTQVIATQKWFDSDDDWELLIAYNQGMTAVGQDPIVPHFKVYDYSSKTFVISDLGSPTLFLSKDAIYLQAWEDEKRIRVWKVQEGITLSMGEKDKSRTTQSQLKQIAVTDQTLKISFNGKKPHYSKASIYDLKGRNVLSHTEEKKATKNMNLNIANLADGVYVGQLQGADKRLSFKFQK